MSDSPLWRFSLALYAAPGVAEACLQLQDEHGIDVNVMLYLLYLASAQRQVDAVALDRIESIVRAWREAVVIPLRSVRRSLKTALGPFETRASAPLRAEVKRMELAAERLQQQTMERLAPASSVGVACSDRLACARANLALYAERMGAFPDASIELIVQRFAQTRLDL